MLLAASNTPRVPIAMRVALTSTASLTNRTDLNIRASHHLHMLSNNGITFLTPFPPPRFTLARVHPFPSAPHFLQQPRRCRLQNQEPCPSATGGHPEQEDDNDRLLVLSAPPPAPSTRHSPAVASPLRLLLFLFIAIVISVEIPILACLLALYVSVLPLAVFVDLGGFTSPARWCGGSSVGLSAGSASILDDCEVSVEEPCVYLCEICAVKDG